MDETTRMMWLRLFLRLLSVGFLAAFSPWITLILLNAPILAPGGTLARWSSRSDAPCTSRWPANRMMTRTVRGHLRVCSATCDLNINDGIRACGDGHVVEVVSRFGGKHADNPFER